MINCPKCGTPNPDQETVCLACGASLVAEAFAQAMDRAQGVSEPPAVPPGAEPGAEPAAPPAAPAPAPQAAASDPFSPVPAEQGVGFAGFDPSAAQADIDAYMKAQKAKKRRKSMIYLIIFFIVAGGLGFVMYRSSQQEAAKKEAARFLKAFFDVNNGPVAGFWRCAVRAKHKDIHLMPPDAVVDGLDGVFHARPKTQPDYIRRKCMPLIGGAVAQLDALKPPEDFKARLTKMKKTMPRLKTAFEAYIKKMDTAKELAQHEKDILAANAAFHDAAQSDLVKIVGYVNVLSCVIPELPSMLKEIKQPPDVEPVMKVLKAELKKNAIALADKFRKECYPKLKEIKRVKKHAQIVKKMSGDDRDGQAIKFAFKRANKDTFRVELNAVGKAFAEYRNAVVKVQEVAKKYKDEGH
jgi:hypothetical protein